MYTIVIRVASTDELKDVVRIADEHEIEYTIAPQQVYLFIPNIEKFMEISQALHDKP